MVYRRTNEQEFMSTTPRECICQTLFLALGLMMVASPAFAYHPSEGTVTATLGPYSNKTDFSGSSTGATSQFSPGFGFLAQGDINDKSSLEIAIFYMKKTYFRENSSLFIAERTDVTQINMGYRYWLGTYVSTALAFYSAYSLGDVQVVHNDFPIDVEIGTSARDMTEYGLDFSLQWEIWTHKDYSIVIDGRYAHSFTNKENEIGNHLGGLLGFKYAVQKK